VDYTGKTIDHAGWTAYARGGHEHYERVERCWSVFRLNASELRALLVSVETNPVASALLAQAAPRSQMHPSQLDFWNRLDQRLHNMVAAAATLIDQTRPLVEHYNANEEFVTEWTTRNEVVRDLPVSSFLRRLRNYLLHCGVPPIAHTLRLGPAPGQGEWDNFRVQLSSAALLKWSGWNATQRDYLASFDLGPSLRNVAEEYFTAMVDLYKWLSEQQSVLHVPGHPPAHLVS